LPSVNKRLSTTPLACGRTSEISNAVVLPESSTDCSTLCGCATRTPTSVGGICCCAPACWSSFGHLLQPTSPTLVASTQHVRAGAQSFADIIVSPLLDLYLNFLICAPRNI